MSQPQQPTLGSLMKASTTPTTPTTVTTTAASTPAMAASSTPAAATATAATSQPTQPTSSGKLWGGRFTGATDPIFEQYNASIAFDRQLWEADVAGSRAYATALAKAGTITTGEADTLRTGLDRVADEWRQGTFQIQPNDEDIHTANERRLGDFVGTVAGKLHTGRSRNDQVATDIRLYVRAQIQLIKQLLRDLILTTAAQAEQHMAVLLPGFTHLQPAQPIRFSHFLLSYAAAWQRDAQRLHDCLKRTSVLPLGSGALAGNPFGLDRAALAAELGFDGGVSMNSLDAVSDRDFIAEFLFVASLTMTHISQISEDLILYSNKKFVTLADAYSTGSSLMPQKKNPDALELLRGKSGRALGNLVAVLTVLKALPRAYNKDLQEDKEPLFDSVRTLTASLQILTGVITTLHLHPAAMLNALVPDMLATDLAEYLVRKGVPFRETHHVAGAAVRLCEQRGVSLFDLTVHDLKGLHAKFDDDVLLVWNYEASAESRNVTGGTSLSSQREQIEKLRQWASEYV